MMSRRSPAMPFLLLLVFPLGMAQECEGDICTETGLLSDLPSSDEHLHVKDVEIAELASAQLLHIVEEATPTPEPTPLGTPGVTEAVEISYVVVAAGTTCGDSGYGDVTSSDKCFGVSGAAQAVGFSGGNSIVSSTHDDKGCFYVNTTNEIVFNSASSSAPADALARYICVVVGCTNYQDGATKWYDAEGPIFDCAWYAQGTRCTAYGDSKANFGMTAKQACCSCGGGVYPTPAPSPAVALDAPITAAPTAAFPDPTPAPTSAPTDWAVVYGQGQKCDKFSSAKITGEQGVPFDACRENCGCDDACVYFQWKLNDQGGWCSTFSTCNLELNRDWNVYKKVSQSSCPLPSPTTEPTPMPTPVWDDATPMPASATGDPHMTNIHGQRFDLMQPGIHALLQIPRDADTHDTLLRVEADARHIGAACADMYIQSLNITGTWAEEKLRANGKPHAGGFRYLAQPTANQKGTNWQRFGRVDLKVVWGRTIEGIDYLNLFVKHLAHAGHTVGGLLGEDDHTAAATPSAQCKIIVELAPRAQETNGARSGSIAEAS